MSEDEKNEEREAIEQGDAVEEDSQPKAASPEARRIFEQLLDESTGMTSTMRRELFAQQKRVLGGYVEAPLSVVVASTEGNTLFHGVDRDMLGAVRAAAGKIGADPRAAVDSYARKLADRGAERARPDADDQG